MSYRLQDLQLESLLGLHLYLPKIGGDMVEIITSDANNIYCSNLRTRKVNVAELNEIIDDAYLIESNSTIETLKNSVYKQKNGGFLVLAFDKPTPSWSYYVKGVFEGSSKTAFDLLISLSKKALDEK